MTDDEDDENYPEPNTSIHDHCNYMSVRENMQEFPGRVPHRKRKKGSENPQQEDSSKPKVRNERKSVIPLVNMNLWKWKGREEEKNFLSP